jgi:hypothetical protein
LTPVNKTEKVSIVPEELYIPLQLLTHKNAFRLLLSVSIAVIVLPLVLVIILFFRRRSKKEEKSPL